MPLRTESLIWFSETWSLSTYVNGGGPCHEIQRLVEELRLADVLCLRSTSQWHHALEGKLSHRGAPHLVSFTKTDSLALRPLAQDMGVHLKIQWLKMA